MQVVVKIAWQPHLPDAVQHGVPNRLLAERTQPGHPIG